MGSDNAAGAENQQERLIRTSAGLSGFVDGEGCFSIGFVRQPNRASRQRLQNRLSGVSSSSSSRKARRACSCLEELRELLRSRAASTSTRGTTTIASTCVSYIVEPTRRTSSETIIPFFRRASAALVEAARTSRQFAQLRRADRRRSSFDDRTGSIADRCSIARDDEPSKNPGTNLIRILRGHTPNTLDTG